MTKPLNSEPPPASLTECDREPIHIPGTIQPYGVLAVLDEGDLSVRQVSVNLDRVLGGPAEEVVGRPLAAVVGEDVAVALAPTLRAIPLGGPAALVGTLPVRGVPTHVLAHRTGQGVILELEPVTASPDADVHDAVDAFTQRAEEARTVAELSSWAAEVVQRLTGFDRVLVYQFDDGWNGMVVGEAVSGRLPSLLDHRFPAADIPAQARELYRLNRVRIIPDVDYLPAKLVPPAVGQPLDMSFAALRSVSPVHLEYMRNMGTAASMSVSVLRDGRLWGLLSCHHVDAKGVPFPVRRGCDLIARTFALRLGALEHTRDFERRLEVRAAFTRLLAGMTDRGDFATALVGHPDDLLALAAASGAAVLTTDACRTVGETPTEDQVRELAGWLFSAEKEEVYHTDALPDRYPPAAAFKSRASGLLAVAVSKLHPSYVLWFRPEVVRTIRWGGDPTKAADDPGSRPWLHPRKSFATWLETVRNRSHPWDSCEVEAAAELRNAVVGVVLRRAEELAALNAELTRSNRELEAFSYSVSHDLRAPLRHISGYAELLREPTAAQLTPRGERCVATVIESCEYAGMLVDKLLAYSQMGRADLHPSVVDMTALFRETVDDVAAATPDRHIVWQIQSLPPAVGDLVMLRLAVRNLLENAVKYTRRRDPARIEVGGDEVGDEVEYFVNDNGVGFDMRYADKLFGVFQRLHRMEDYEGTGIGLANVRRIVERHGGRTWAVGEEGRGATFHFTLPKVFGA